MLPVKAAGDIPAIYRSTPIALLLEYHNMGKEPEQHVSAQLLIGMCMDNRKQLRIPDNFAFIIRTAGANLRYSDFAVSFAIAVGGVKHIALIAHNDCRMVNLESRREAFIEGMVRTAGWAQEEAENHFDRFAPMFEIGSETEFIASEARRLREQYTMITVCPMLYRVEDGTLDLVEG